ncbi:MAG: elongation factor G [Spirochaetaceae bacterium]|nr:elongation factor G [Spirochaetaceae bacterium]
MSTSASDIRNVALIGHGGTGKTSLVEQALVRGKVVPKFAPVDGGKSVSDHAPEEIARGISVHAAIAHLPWKGAKINLLDTPGSADFIGEVVAALHVSDVAVMVVGGDVGVQIETAKLWRRLQAAGKPCIVFVNQMDKEHANFANTLADLREKLSGSFVPAVVPIGDGAGFSGVVDLLSGKALTHMGGQESPGTVPDDLADTVEEYRQGLIEGAAEGSDELMEKYLDEETLSDDEVRTGLAASLHGNLVVPVVAGSATLNSGVASLLDVLQAVAPSAAAGAGVDGGGAPAAFVFKTSIDQYSGRLSWIKVMSGEITPDTELVDTRDGRKERITKLFTLCGSQLVDSDGLAAGDLGVFTKLTSAATGDTLAQQADLTYPPLDLPQPVHAVTLAAHSKKDEDKLGQFLSRVAEEDPTFRVRYNGETRETVVSAMGELQLSIALERLKNTAKVEVETNVPRVAYRETITRPAGAEYQHKKQTGGHGQYAKVEIRIKPLPRGEEFSFVNQVVGGAISKGYIPGVEKGLREGMAGGVLAGFPVVDVEVALVDGKEHSVDSSELAFSLAARGALRSALDQARPVLLEPVANLTVYVEESYLGDVLSDLSGRRGRIQGQEPVDGGMLEVRALVPQAELVRYAIDLKSMTSGTASFEMAFDNYAPLTGRMADDIIKRSREPDAVASGR